jgi:hypothetical protein
MIIIMYEQVETVILIAFGELSVRFITIIYYDLII